MVAITMCVPLTLSVRPVVRKTLNPRIHDLPVGDWDTPEALDAHLGTLNEPSRLTSATPSQSQLQSRLMARKIIKVEALLDQLPEQERVGLNGIRPLHAVGMAVRGLYPVHQEFGR